MSLHICIYVDIHICTQLFIRIYTFIHTYTCHIHIHMYVINTYAYICTHIQYTEQTIDYQKPKMCISNYLFFSDGSPRLLLENTCEVTALSPLVCPAPCPQAPPTPVLSS